MRKLNKKWIMTLLALVLALAMGLPALALAPKAAEEETSDEASPASSTPTDLPVKDATPHDIKADGDSTIVNSWAASTSAQTPPTPPCCLGWAPGYKRRSSGPFLGQTARPVTLQRQLEATTGGHWRTATCLGMLTLFQLFRAAHQQRAAMCMAIWGISALVAVVVLEGQ